MAMRVWNGDEENVGGHEIDEDDEDEAYAKEFAAGNLQSGKCSVSTPRRSSCLKGRPSFKRFADEQQKVVTAKYPFLSKSQIRQKVRKLWVQLSDEDRSYYCTAPKIYCTPKKIAKKPVQSSGLRKSQTECQAPETHRKTPSKQPVPVVAEYVFSPPRKRPIQTFSGGKWKKPSSFYAPPDVIESRQSEQVGILTTGKPNKNTEKEKGTVSFYGAGRAKRKKPARCVMKLDVDGVDTETSDCTSRETTDNPSQAAEEQRMLESTSEMGPEYSSRSWSNGSDEDSDSDREHQLMQLHNAPNQTNNKKKKPDNRSKLPDCNNDSDSDDGQGSIHRADPDVYDIKEHLDMTPPGVSTPRSASKKRKKLARDKKKETRHLNAPGKVATSAGDTELGLDVTHNRTLDWNTESKQLKKPATCRKHTRARSVPTDPAKWTVSRRGRMEDVTGHTVVPNGRRSRRRIEQDRKSDDRVPVNTSYNAGQRIVAMKAQHVEEKSSLDICRKSRQPLITEFIVSKQNSADQLPDANEETLAEGVRLHAPGSGHDPDESIAMEQTAANGKTSRSNGDVKASGKRRRCTGKAKSGPVCSSIESDCDLFGGSTTIESEAPQQVPIADPLEVSDLVDVMNFDVDELSPPLGRTTQPSMSALDKALQQLQQVISQEVPEVSPQLSDFASPIQLSSLCSPIVDLIPEVIQDTCVQSMQMTSSRRKPTQTDHQETNDPKNNHTESPKLDKKEVESDDTDRSADDRREILRRMKNVLDLRRHDGHDVNEPKAAEGAPSALPGRSAKDGPSYKPSSSVVKRDTVVKRDKPEKQESGTEGSLCELFDKPKISPDELSQPVFNDLFGNLPPDQVRKTSRSQYELVSRMLLSRFTSMMIQHLTSRNSAS